MATYKYFVYGESDELYEFESVWECDFNNQDSLKLLAETMAEDYHYNHEGGWSENSFIDITILNGTQELATFDVDIEYVPTFSAYRIDDD